jgi:hypothetical protein
LSMEPMSPTNTEENSAEPVAVMLFMPEESFGEIHGHAARLGITDSALFTACWIAAQGGIESSEIVPQLRATSNAVSGAVYFSLAAAVRDDALAFSQAHDRSMSWVFLKAWAMVRPQVAALSDTAQFRAWCNAKA